jgi:hypothetical protein
MPDRRDNPPSCQRLEWRWRRGAIAGKLTSDRSGPDEPGGRKAAGLQRFCRIGGAVTGPCQAGLLFLEVPDKYLSKTPLIG